MDLPVTKPGYQVFSSYFIVEYIGAKQMAPYGWRELDLEDNWHHMMVELANAFEMYVANPRHLDRIEEEAKLLLNFDIRVENVEVPDCFICIDHRVHVYLKDVVSDTRSKLIFIVKKKQEIKKLQRRAAETISNFVSKKEDFEHLEVPKRLFAYLNEVYDEMISGKIMEGYIRNSEGQNGRPS